MAPKEHLDSKEARSLRGRLKRTFASGVDDKSVFGLYRSEMKYYAPSAELVFFGPIGATVFGALAGAIYAETMQEIALDTEISYGIEDTAQSYQGMGEHILQHQGEDGGYAIYAPDYSDGDLIEFDYQDDTGEALGALYNMRTILKEIVETYESGTALSEDQKNYFFRLEGMTVLHEEEQGTAEREFSAIMRGALTDSEIAERAEMILPYIQQAFDSINTNDQYGLSEEDLASRPDYMSGEHGLWVGTKTGLSILASYMALTTMLGAGVGTSRRMRYAREDKQKKRPSFI